MQGIDLKLIRAFVMLGEKSNYQKAAKSLFITQPALSKQIQTLEALTEGRLFNRGRHGATLTEFGKQLLPKASDILISHESFLKYAKQINKNLQKKILIGFGISSSQSLPIWIDKFSHQYSNYDVHINQLPSSIQMNMLLEGSLHVGFGRIPTKQNLMSQVIDRELFALAVPINANITSNNLQNALVTYPLYQLDPANNPCLAEQTTLFLQKHKLSANIIPIMGDMTTLLALVAGGCGVAFLPQSMQQFLPSTVKLIIPKENTIGWDIGIIWNAEIKNHIRDTFIQIVLENKVLPTI